MLWVLHGRTWVRNRYGCSACLSSTWLNTLSIQYHIASHRIISQRIAMIRESKRYKKNQSKAKKDHELERAFWRAAKWDIAIEHRTVQYNTAQYSTVQYSTVQYNTVQYSAVQNNTVQYNTVQYSIWHNRRYIQGIRTYLLSGMSPMSSCTSTARRYTMHVNPGSARNRKRKRLGHSKGGGRGRGRGRVRGQW